MGSLCSCLVNNSIGERVEERSSLCPADGYDSVVGHSFLGFALSTRRSVFFRPRRATEYQKQGSSVVIRKARCVIHLFS